jgi:hypothetical protein
MHRRSLQPFKEKIQHNKHETFKLFSIFSSNCVLLGPYPESEYGSETLQSSAPIGRIRSKKLTIYHKLDYFLSVS